MAWIAPKTTWTPQDGVSDADFNRIEGNISDLDTRKANVDNPTFTTQITTPKIVTTSNGNADNIQIGDDAFIGDANMANGFRITGKQDGKQGLIQLGNSSSAPTIGYNGTNLVLGPHKFNTDGTAIQWTDDLNNITATGFYRVSNVANIPSNNSVGDTNTWWYIEHIQHDSSWCLQVAYQYQSHRKFERQKVNGTWSAWADTHGMRKDMGSSQDINWLFENGVYSIYDDGGLSSSFPPGVYKYGTLICFRSGSAKGQIYMEHSNGRYWVRNTWGAENSINWTGWNRLMVENGDAYVHDLISSGWIYGDKIVGKNNGYVIQISNGAPCQFDTTGSSWRLGRDGSNYIRQDSDNAVVFVMGGVSRHIFYSGGTKSGGSIEIDGHTYGMSPIDSPKILIDDIITDIQLNSFGVKIFLDDKLSKALDKYSVFPNNPTAIITEKTDKYFVVKGEGLADFIIRGFRTGYSDVNWDDLEHESRIDQDLLDAQAAAQNAGEVTE